MYAEQYDFLKFSFFFLVLPSYCRLSCACRQLLQLSCLIINCLNHFNFIMCVVHQTQSIQAPPKINRHLRASRKLNIIQTSTVCVYEEMWMLLRSSICFINMSYERLPNVPSVHQIWMWSSLRKPSGVDNATGAALLCAIVLSVPQSDLSHYCTLSDLFELQVCCRALAHHKNILSPVCSFWEFFFFLFFSIFPIEILWKEWGVCEKYYGL